MGELRGMSAAERRVLIQRYRESSATGQDLTDEI
jgi:hypothetical protein